PYNWAIVAAYRAGIVTGRSQTHFAPEESITREEMAAMIIRAYEVKSGMKVVTQGQGHYADDNLINDWAKSVVYASLGLGLLHGRGENEFAPQGLTTRAESAQVIANLLEK
ncbi:S-layer homology domain-containing protein, partial [Paenibacillus sp. TAF58]